MEGEMENIGLVSADSHVMEPADLWTKRLDRKYHKRAPRIIEKEGVPFLKVEGLRPYPVAGAYAAGKSGEELKEHHAKEGLKSARPGGWDPVARIKDQEIDGVQAEVIYCSLGMPLFRIEDGDLQRACFRVYNDWLAEFCSYSPKRLYGAGLISLIDIDEAARELERVHKKGLRSAMIWASPPEDKPYRSRIYDRFWQAASELQMPLALHIVTGKGKESDLEEEDESNISAIYMTVVHEVQRSLSDIVMGGVLERFPKLKVVSAENDIGWLPHFMYRLDHGYDKYNALAKEPLPHKPSEYIRRQVFATFEDDPVGVSAYKFFGAENFMWANDFPHGASTWPESSRYIARMFADIPAEVTRKIIRENAAKLYRMDLN